MLNKEQNKLLLILFSTITGIIIANIVNIFLGEPSWQITRLIDVGLEQNFPTWFLSLLLAIAAFQAYSCSRHAQKNLKESFFWKILSAGLIAMSCDEVATIHDNLGSALN